MYNNRVDVFSTSNNVPLCDPVTYFQTFGDSCYITLPIQNLREWVWHFPESSDNKESTCNAVDSGLIPGSGRSPGGGHAGPL